MQIWLRNENREEQLFLVTIHSVHHKVRLSNGEAKMSKKYIISTPVNE